MGRDIPSGLAHHIRGLVGLWRTDPRTDGELLSAFLAGDGAAFAFLVVRHGQPVWATCRRVLGNDADAEDAFQATFIALARKASQVRPDAITGWLQKVSCEVALNARKAAQRRAAAQHRLFEQAAVQAPDPPTEEDLREVVHEELNHLPERLRVPLVLYYLEGKTQAELGHILGVTDRAAAHRLKQGLQHLRERLARRGSLITASVLVGLLGRLPTASALPFGLAEQAAEAALTVAAGGQANATATRLALEATRAPGWAHLKLRTWLLLPAIGALVGGIVLAQRPAPPERTDPTPSRESEAPRKTARTDSFGDPLPPGALARLGTLRFRIGEPGGVSSVAFGPGGKVLVSVHGGDTVHFWDPESAREVRRLAAPAMCWAVSATPDGKRLAAAGASEVWAWDLSGDAPRLLWKAPAKTTGPSTVEFSPDGRWIACGGDAGKDVHLLNATNGTIASTLPGRGCRFAFSADAKQLASWSWSRSAEVCVWDVATGALRHTLAAGQERDVVGAVAFSPDGKALATVGQDRQLRLWDTDKGTKRRQLAGDADPHAFIGFAPDGRTLIEIGGGRVRYWNPATGAAAKPSVKTAPGAWSTAYRFSADCARVARACPFGVGVWDVATGRELGAAAGMPDGFVHPVTFSPDGATVATAAFSESAGSSVHLWDAATGRHQREIAVVPRQMVWGIDFAADGTLSASLGTLVELPPKPPERIARWDAKTSTARPELALPEKVTCVALAPDGAVTAVATPTGVTLHDRATGREIKKLSGSGTVECLAYSADGNALAALDIPTGRVTVWSLADGRERKWSAAPEGRDKHPALRAPVALSADGRLVAVGSAGAKAGIRIVDVPTGAERHPLDAQTHGWMPQEFAFAPDGRTLASAGADGVVRVWDLASGRERYRFAGHRSAALAVAFSPDGRRLASASMDSTALIWDVYAPQQPATEQLSTERLWSALSGTDGGAAHRAVAALAAAPATAVPFLKSRLCLPPASAEEIRRWVGDLEAEQFAVREAATEELARRGDQVGAELRRALAATTSVEARARLRRLVAKLGPNAPANWATVRGIEALERMGSDPAAKKLLNELAEWPPESVTGYEARAACKRLAGARPPRN